MGYAKGWTAWQYLPLLLWLVFAQVQAETIVRRMEVSNPRPFGHVIGDILHQQIDLELVAPYRLDADSLPRAGRMNRWLEMRAPVVKRRHNWGGTNYRILLTYQTFYPAQQLESLVIPSLEFSVGDGDHVLPLLVPEWSFSVAPLAVQATDASAVAAALRADQPPPTKPVKPHLYRLIALSLCLLVAILYLIYVYWGIPFLERRHRPFSMAYRRLKKLERRPFSNALYLEALRSLHRAFDLAAGRTLVAGNLETFFVEHPEFAALRTHIETLFMRSRMAFFEPHRQAATDAVSLQNLLQLCHRCRAVERGIP